MASVEKMRQIWADILGIEPSDIGDNDSFMDLGGDSVKAIQFLGEVASYAAQVDLAAFLNTGTIQSFWEIIKDAKDINGHESGGSEGLLGTMEETSPATDTDTLFSALERAGIAKDDVLRTAPVSPVQDFFLHLGLLGNAGLINYVYEVEGQDLMRGLRQLTELLEAKNPIFRTTIVDAGEGKFAQVLLAKSSPCWSYPRDLRSYVEGVSTQMFQLGASAAQYALVLGDPALGGRNFFTICMHHTHCDAFSRFLISKEILQILQSPSDYARDENVQRPWFGDYVKRVGLQEDLSPFWDSYLRGVNVANIYPLEQATVDGEFDGAVEDTIPAPIAHRGASSLLSRNPTQVVLGAWVMALAKLSGLRDIAFGLCRHGRSSSSLADVRRIMGPLVNGLPFHISVQRDEEPVTGLLQRVQREITVTSRWEHEFAPGVFPSADGRPWVQSLVNLKSELHGMKDAYTASDDAAAVTKMFPRAELSAYDMKGHWAVLLSVEQQRNVFRVSMYYQSTLLAKEKAAALFNHFKGFVNALSTADGESVGSLIG